MFSPNWKKIRAKSRIFPWLVQISIDGELHYGEGVMDISLPTQKLAKKLAKKLKRAGLYVNVISLSDYHEVNLARANGSVGRQHFTGLCSEHGLVRVYVDRDFHGERYDACDVCGTKTERLSVASLKELTKYVKQSEKIAAKLNRAA